MSEDVNRRRELLKYRWKRYGIGYLFVLPWLIGFGAFMAVPLFTSLYMSFNRISFAGGKIKYEWIGLENFHKAIVVDNIFPVELILYFQEMLLIIPIIVIFAFVVALLLNQNFPLRFMYRGIFFLPVIFATGQVLTELFAQGAGDLPFMKQYNLDLLISKYVGQQLAEPVLNVLGKVILILWYSGVQIIIYLAGFQAISKSLYEAVWIDGASPWDSFWKITLPHMLPFVSLCTLYTIVELFTYPNNPIIRQIKANMFRADSGFGYSNAMAWIYFSLIIVLLGLALWFVQRSAGRKEGAR